MPKRGYSSRDTLTGGSKDVNPQTYVVPPVTMTAADTTVFGAIPVPIPRLPIKEGRALVMEILNIDFYLQNAGYVANSTTWQNIALTTNPQPNDLSLTNDVGLGLFEDPRTIAIWSRQALASAAPTAFAEFDSTKHIDLTDEAGHGFLVATDNLYIVLSSLNTASTNRGAARLSYRFKDVSLTEYIGIVQSQQ